MKMSYSIDFFNKGWGFFCLRTQQLFLYIWNYSCCLHYCWRFDIICLIFLFKKAPPFVNLSHHTTPSLSPLLFMLVVWRIGDILNLVAIEMTAGQERLSFGKKTWVPSFFLFFYLIIDGACHGAKTDHDLTAKICIHVLKPGISGYSCTVFRFIRENILSTPAFRIL